MAREQGELPPLGDDDFLDSPEQTQPRSSLDRDCLAVLVTDGEGGRLPRVLRSLADQTLLPSRLRVMVVGGASEAGAGDGAGAGAGDGAESAEAPSGGGEDSGSDGEGSGSNADGGEARDEDGRRDDAENDSDSEADSEAGAAPADSSVAHEEGRDRVQGLVDTYLGNVDLPVDVVTSAATTLSAAVNEAVGEASGREENASTGGKHAKKPPEPEAWVWILHADAALDPECFEWLARRGASSSKIGAVGPKQVSWENRASLIEVGIRATRSGRRVPEIGEADRDQGQLDAREDVLGVGSAGMLIRREALDAIGGLDPVLGPFGDGLETSRRLWAGGWRVVVQPRAVIRHAQESMSRARRATFARRRAAQLYNAVLAAPAVLVPFLWIGYVIAAPLRAIVRLAMKEPHMAWPELRGGWLFITSTAALSRARRRLRGATTASHSVLRTLEDAPSDVRRAQRAERKALRDAAEMAKMPDQLVLRERRQNRRRTRSWAVGTVVVTAVAAAVGLIQVIGHGVLTGGALLPDASGLGDLASMAASGWLPSGSGVDAPVDALWLLLSPLVAISEPIGGSLGAVATLIILLAIPLAGLSSYFAAGALTRAPQLRFAAGLVWAFAPPLLGAVSVGQVAGVVWHVCAPLAVALLVRCWHSTSVSLVGRASIVLAIMCAAAPFTLIALVGVVVAAIVRKAWRWLWIPVPAVALLAPTFFSGAADWRLLFSVPGAGVASQPSWLGLLSLNPTGTAASFADVSQTELAFLIGMALLGIVAILSLFRTHRAPWIRWGWATLGFGLIWALVDSLVATSVSTAGGVLTPVNAWPGVALSCAAGGLWLVVVNAGDGMRSKLQEYSFGLHQLGGALIALAVLGGAIGPVGLWAVNSADELKLSATSEEVPAIAATAQEGTAHSRVLMLEPHESGVEAHVYRGLGPQLHEASMIRGIEDVKELDGSGSAARQSLANAIADASGSGETTAQILGEHAISMIVVPPDDSSTARAGLIGQLSSLGGLQYITENNIGAFWRVRTDTDSGPSSLSRLRITEYGQPEDADASEGAAPHDISLPSGQIGADIDVKPGQPGRILVLAERADPGWRATLDGHALEPVDHDWRQAWKLPATGGELAIGHGPSVPWPGIVQAGLMLVAVIIALPLRRRRYES